MNRCVLCVVLGLGACAPTAETVDVLTDNYVGEVHSDNLVDTLTVDEGSTLGVGFYTKGDALWAGVRFEGVMHQGIIVVEGPQVDTIEGVTVDGNDLSCVYKDHAVTGTFADDRGTLQLVVADVGTVDLLRVEDGDTGDNADTADTAESPEEIGDTAS